MINCTYPDFMRKVKKERAPKHASVKAPTRPRTSALERAQAAARAEQLEKFSRGKIVDAASLDANVRP